MTREAPPTLCVINYNGEAYLEETLRAAKERADLFAEILLLDNHSNDGSVALVNRQFPEVRTVVLGENRGPSAARNRGWREAKTDRILFVDNDVVLSGRCVELLCEALDSHTGAVAAMPSVLYAGDPGTVQYDGAGVHYLGQMTLHGQNSPRAGQERAIRSIDSLVTACFLVDRGRWGDDDPFDENLFIYFEDHDFGIRIRLRGGEILSVPDAACLHREGTEGLSLRKTGKYTANRVKNVIRNRWQVIVRNYSARTLLLLAPALLLYEFSQLLMVIARGWLGPWVSSLWWMIANGGDLMRRRAAIQRSRVLPDREILGGGPIPLADQIASNRIARAARCTLDFLVQQYWRLVRRAI